MERKDVLAELAEIQAAHDGLLRAEDVVEYARNPETALHSKFTWDDGEAAREYRLWQARQVIRVHVTVFESVTEPVRMFVNLMADRKEPGGGYRAISEVMQDAGMRAQLLKQAMQEARIWQAKYRALKELEPVFVALDSVEYPLAEAAD